jgi:hypothetical protein
MALKAITWKDVKIGETVFIDNYENGKFPSADPRISGPYTVEVGNGCGRWLKNPRNGRGFMHYPDNLLVEIPKSPNPMYTDEQWDMMDRLLKFKMEQPDLFWATVEELKKSRKSQIKEISVARHEGPKALCIETKNSTFVSAQREILHSSETAPAEGGYDKHTLVFLWENGQKWLLRMDVGRTRETNDNNILKALKQEVSFYAGAWKPEHLTEEQAQTIRNRQSKAVLEKAKSVLAECEIPDFVLG